jgi:solute:Na+ symporter, SSS family
LIHVQATAFGQDILKTLGINTLFGSKLNPSRIGVLIGVIAAVILAYLLPAGIIAQATAFLVRDLCRWIPASFNRST